MQTDTMASVLYARDVHQLSLILGKFLQKSGAETVLLVDEAGHLLARQGAVPPANEATVAALVAGTYGASRAMARMVGPEEFSTMIPCADGRIILLLRAGDHALLAVTFGDDSSETLVRTYALEAIRRIATILAATLSERTESGEQIESRTFHNEIDDALTDVFG